MEETQEENMTVNGALNISVDVSCPECHKCIDLISIDILREDGWIYDLVMPTSKHWAGACKDFSTEYLDAFGEDFRCPHCNKVINIGEIEY